MNYLVHLSLAYPHAEYIPGNFVFDLLPRAYKMKYPSSLHTGIQLHKIIDHYSNNHPAMFQFHSGFHPYVHKYAPVASDIVSDYLMYRSWDLYMTIDFNSFTQWIYTNLNRHLGEFPELAQVQTRNMIESNWLYQYRTVDGLEKILRRMNAKLRFEGDLTKVLVPFSSNEKFYLNLFEWFYADMKSYCNDWISLQSGRKL